MPAAAADGAKKNPRRMTGIFLVCNGYLQFLQPFASDAFLEAFACLPDCALELSLVAEDCLPFALDLVFSMFTPFGGSPRVQTFACRG